MNHRILIENEKRRIEVPMFQLICFSMFCTWQMGFIYFMGPSLAIDGRMPLPISMDNITALIVAGYVLAIIFMLILPHKIVWAERLSAFAALITVIGLFFPLEVGTLKLFVYVHVFFCCFMIGFETFIIINLFSEKSAITHLTFAYAVALLLIAIVQNDFVKLSFSTFRFLTIIMLLMMLIFFFWLPDDETHLLRYVKKSDKLPCPKSFIAGICVLIFISCLMMVCGPAAVGEITHGVFFAYVANALTGFIIYLFYKKKNVHPIRSLSVTIGLSVMGFLFLFTSSYIPALAIPACLLIGAGFIPCQMIPLYGFVMMKNYPSRFITPLCMAIALITVIIHSAIVEIFRTSATFLHLAYLFLMVILCVVYMLLAPFLVNVLQQKTEAAKKADSFFAQLTKREYEVLNLLSLGYSNADIAKSLVISEHTVNDYTKKIYRKLNVHSRHSAAMIFQKHSK